MPYKKTTATIQDLVGEEPAKKSVEPEAASIQSEPAVETVGRQQSEVPAAGSEVKVSDSAESSSESKEKTPPLEWPSRTRCADCRGCKYQPSRNDVHSNAPPHGKLRAT